MNVYSPGQVRHIFKWWPTNAKWFVLGGPADGDEAQVVKQTYPHVQCIGYEPNPVLHAKQRAMNFPGVLHSLALWSKPCTLELDVPIDAGPRSGSVCRDMGDTQVHKHKVLTTTLDYALWLHGCEDIVLWLDCEEAELEILAGGKEFLKRTLLLNLEASNPRRLNDYDELLVPQGFKRLDCWNTNSLPGLCDALYGRE